MASPLRTPASIAALLCFVCVQSAPCHGATQSFTAPKGLDARSPLTPLPTLSIPSNAELVFELAWVKAAPLAPPLHVLLRLVAADGSTASWTWDLHQRSATQTSTQRIRGKYYERVEVALIKHATMTHRLISGPSDQADSAADASTIALWSSIPISTGRSQAPSRSEIPLILVRDDAERPPPSAITATKGDAPPVTLSASGQPMPGALAIALRVGVEVIDRTRPPEPEKRPEKDRRPDPVKNRPPRDIAATLRSDPGT